MPIELYPSIAKIKRNGVYENLPGFVPETGAVATQQMIATAESTATAQYVHNKGEYFRLNDTLYQAIVKINVGDAIVVGTNCEVAVIGNDLTHVANSIAAYELGIATSSHNTGDYFMVGETLYVATADIQVGDNISTSTNCRPAVVGNELSELKNAANDLDETVNGVITYNYTEGKNFYVATGVHTIVDDPNSCISELISVTPFSSGYSRYYFTDSSQTSGTYHVFFYDSNKEYLTNYGSSTGTYRALEVPATAGYVQFSFKKGYAGKITESANPPTVTRWIAASTVATPGLVQKVGDLANLNTTEKTNLVGAVNEIVQNLGEVDQNLGNLANLNTTEKTNLVGAVNEVDGRTRRVINVNSSDTEAQIIQKLVNAYTSGDCDVVFERADYTFGDELESVKTDYNLAVNEIPIGNNCRYFFNGSTLTATIDLSNHPASGGEEFYCNFFGVQKMPNNFEMYDGVLIATDTRYVVHDEAAAKNGTYKHKYQNIEMVYNTSLREDIYRKCIGGGTGKSGVVEIIGCKFTTDSSEVAVSFHGNQSDVLGSKFDLVVRNSWFSNSIRAGELSEHQTARLFFAGNSTGSAIQTYTGWTVTSFLNEVRT